MTRLPRFRFSLGTLLLAVAWSGVMVRLNTTPTVWDWAHDFLGADPKSVALSSDFGWPWPCVVFYDFHNGTAPNLLTHDDVRLDWFGFVGDVVVGVLLVTALTWVSGFLVRRAKQVFRRVESPSC